MAADRTAVTTNTANGTSQPDRFWIGSPASSAVGVMTMVREARLNWSAQHAGCSYHDQRRHKPICSGKRAIVGGRDVFAARRHGYREAGTDPSWHILSARTQGNRGTMPARR